MGLDFEWDEAKAGQNFENPGVPFSEATTVFADPLAITISDPDHQDESRFVDLGLSYLGRTLVVVFTQRGDTVRIISARRATRRESVAYEEGP